MEEASEKFGGFTCNSYFVSIDEANVQILRRYIWLSAMIEDYVVWPDHQEKCLTALDEIVQLASPATTLCIRARVVLCHKGPQASLGMCRIAANGMRPNNR
jgi:7-cyano-7-deazaguanine synthase in queuosine biosynthesis